MFNVLSRAGRGKKGIGQGAGGEGQRDAV